MQKLGAGLTGSAVVLLLIDVLIGAVLPFEAAQTLGPVVSIAGLWWMLLVLGLVLFGVSRLGIRIPAVPRSASLRRQDIIVATDWMRIGTHIIRRSYGIALAASAALLLVVSLALQEFVLAALWFVLLLVGVVLVVLTWRQAREIVDDHTHTISVRVPDRFTVHAFHIDIRQQIENLGYKIVSNTSPAEGGRASPIDSRLFHADGAIKGRRRPVADSRELAPDIENTYLREVLTVATAGVFAALLGITVLGVTESTEAMAAGALLLLAGIVVVSYDYFTRTREWSELYCVEEGTVFAAEFNEYREGVPESMRGSIQPNVAAQDTGAVLSVTVGATCTSLYDGEKLTEDFETLADSIEAAADRHQLDFVVSQSPLDEPPLSSADVVEGE